MEVPAPQNGWRSTIEYRVSEAERDIQHNDEAVKARIDALEGKLNMLIISVIGLALSIAGSAVIFALTILSSRGK